MRDYKLLLCCESLIEELSAGNPHATFCGNQRRVTASNGQVLEGCSLHWPDIGVTQLIELQILGKRIYTERCKLNKSRSTELHKEFRTGLYVLVNFQIILYSVWLKTIQYKWYDTEDTLDYYSNGQLSEENRPVNNKLMALIVLGRVFCKYLR